MIRALSVSVVLVLCGSAFAEPDSLEFTTSSFSVAQPIDNIVLSDFDGDGRDDLLWTRGGSLELFRQLSTGGFDFGQAPPALTIDAASVAWCVTVGGSGENPDHRSRIHTIRNGTVLETWIFDSQERAFKTSGEGSATVAATLPRGLLFLQFLRPVNADTNPDLVYPGSDGVHIRVARDGGYAPAVVVRQESHRELELDTEGDLRAVIGQRIRVPGFHQRDVNGDGHTDLVSEDEARLFVHLGAADGTFARDPSYGVDYSEELQRASEDFQGDMDPTNIMAAALPKYEVSSRDVTGDGREDVVLRRGDRIFVHHAGAGGVDLGKPSQVLRVSGNLVTMQFGDENEDDLPDLLLARMEALSLSDVFLWLVMSGSIELRFLIYHNDGQKFSRRPDREVVVNLTFPNLLSMMKSSSDSVEEAPAALVIDQADIAGTGESNDAVLLEARRLVAFLGGSPKSEEQEAGNVTFRAMLDLIGYSRKKDSYEVDFRSLTKLGDMKRDALLAAIAGRDPDLEIPLAGVEIPESVQPSLYIRDLNHDRRDDLLMFFRDGEQKLRGATFLSR